jgi:hypothetical protein
MGMCGQRQTPAPLTQEGKPLPVLQEAWWAPGNIWTGAENLAPTGFRYPDLKLKVVNNKGAVHFVSNFK